MVLVDTSVWIAHFRERQPVLIDLLRDGLVLAHPFVSGELACGNLSKRASLLADLATLPAAAPATDAEVMRLVESRKLWGRGLGWVDAHLLASALISHCRLWALDKRLRTVASELGLK
jgi:predicted nucleic acid-binding protein